MSALSIAGLRERSYAGVVTTGSMMVLAADGVRAAASDIVARRFSWEECQFQAWFMVRGSREFTGLLRDRDPMSTDRKPISPDGHCPRGKGMWRGAQHAPPLSR